MTAACRAVPVLTTTLDLPLDMRERRFLMAAEIARHNNCAVAIVVLPGSPPP
ncbi:hypothetical protein GCU60_19585 [Blastococcus saxobsidens]|uniref:Uncharacterized protein n=1 Tax=Blastococcus saxobsidens TaxID=138336 RepID=A0A6L9W789_9ACTN|nr:hypothetical protein [Blastococcus saxobsidens]NEK87945.1 hypothetical protein [Blastococcus saxobsidens]